MKYLLGYWKKMMSWLFLFHKLNYSPNTSNTLLFYSKKRNQRCKNVLAAINRLPLTNSKNALRKCPCLHVHFSSVSNSQTIRKTWFNSSINIPIYLIIISSSTSSTLFDDALTWPVVTFHHSQRQFAIRIENHIFKHFDKKYMQHQNKSKCLHVILPVKSIDCKVCSDPFSNVSSNTWIYHNW